MREFQKILVPIDGSITSERAADKAIALAMISGGRLDLINVASIVGSSAGFPGSQMSLPKEILEKIKSSDNMILYKVIAKVPPSIAVKSYCEAGKARDIILEFADKLGSDLIIMGSRGLNPAESILIGSVSQYLIENAKCPVMVVK